MSIVKHYRFIWIDLFSYICIKICFWNKFRPSTINSICNKTFLNSYRQLVKNVENLELAYGLEAPRVGGESKLTAKLLGIEFISYIFVNQILKKIKSKIYTFIVLVTHTTIKYN